jgi:hypothetical protein
MEEYNFEKEHNDNNKDKQIIILMGRWGEINNINNNNIKKILIIILKIILINNIKYIK